ncbi:hypothetical protein M752DRAFT_102530 [Aspergillus phoenicis ATCC 13157]|uniref:Uncharacterized protein n=1 Tax=Aspergillus phoenicis ATCC 13157 TaxID=1353007 RepID=A0A370PW62_ASPPH|nr:hypothetical protein M752DRAFT_102530 [Aspergillus phoenicis ATCC 13157]
MGLSSRVFAGAPETRPAESSTQRLGRPAACDSATTMLEPLHLLGFPSALFLPTRICQRSLASKVSFHPLAVLSCCPQSL